MGARPRDMKEWLLNEVILAALHAIGRRLSYILAPLPGPLSKLGWGWGAYEIDRVARRMAGEAVPRSASEYSKLVQAKMKQVRGALDGEGSKG